MGWPARDWFSPGPRLSPTVQHQIMKAELNHSSSATWIKHSDLTLLYFLLWRHSNEKYTRHPDITVEKSESWSVGNFELISNHWLDSLLTDLRGEERRETDLGILLYFYDFTQNSSSPPIKLERFKVTTNNQQRRNVCIETWKRKHKI